MAMAAFLLFLIILLFPLHSAAQFDGTIPAGASITANGTSNPWRSPNGDFAFGFQTLPDNEDLFVLSIWFDKIPDKTIVWYEKDSFPVRQGSTVRLDPIAGISLQDTQGRTLYTSGDLPGPVVDGVMNNTGNFVLRGNDSTLLWESFKNPTDTMLPGQTIEIAGQLISRSTAANFSEGTFYGRMTADGNFYLSTKTFPSNTGFDANYFNTQTSDNNDSNSGIRLAFSNTAVLSIVRRNGQTTDLKSDSKSPPAIANNYYRATLDFYGVFTQYYHPRNLTGGNPGWTIQYSWPDNICTALTRSTGTGAGACGYNSICRVENSRPNCRCPAHFSLADPSNVYGGCTANYVQTCPLDHIGDEYQLSEVLDANWPENDYARENLNTEEECRRRCLDDCFCGAAVF
ncbi:G-type lectin S-receptor-like serine/threonine-protein kinase LECRK4 [Andrographis paniculata]|uniref:G-type lectin S-receptor-like serine/threonine-protein kinase LECRK4 n=1 Tax=Andrographis paniculata TaxID=175694 RepID=UPI0021E98E7A|nr:G-type lectin S-receptor-like serine/threonine-protein kinase LECRK4 [Andrographis paniculata]